MDGGESSVTAWPPPDGFVAVASQVPGVEVYAPAPSQAPAERTRVYKCPTCGGVTAFSATEQQLTCPHCGRTQAIAAQAVGRQAEEFEFTLEAMGPAEYGWGGQRRELACESCGAVVSIPPDALTNTCTFCGSNRVLARDATGDVLRPTALVPFVVDRARCQALVTEWLGQGWMHPPELRSVRALREMIGVYLPYWTFDVRVRADWQAEVGTPRTERYYDGGEWKTRTVIDWEWRSGRVTVPVNDHLMPGTARVSRVLLRRAGPYDLDELVEYDSGYLAGWQAKTVDVSLRETWEVAREEVREQARRACYEDTGSSHVRSFRMTADFADERWRYVLLPAYLASYHFDKRTFQVLVNGQTGMVSGQKPVAWLRVWLVIAVLFAPGACLGLAGLLAVPLGGVGVIGLMLGFILSAAALIGAAVIFRRARASEEV